MREQQQRLMRQQRRVRLPSPPPCSTSGTSSALSQPISLDFGSHHRPLAKESRTRPSCHYRPPLPPSSSGPIDLDALIGSELDLEDLSRERIVLSSSEDLTTSDSEICRFAGRMAADKRLEANRRFGKFPSLSTIYPDNGSLDCASPEEDHFGLRQVLAARDKARTRKAGGPPRTTHHFLMGADSNDAELRQKVRHAPDALAGTSRSAPRTPQRIPRLEMVEEISPVLPPPDPDEDFDVPPLPRPLQLLQQREWRPLQTSTLTNFHSTANTLPRQRGPKMPQMPQLEPPRSLFDPFFPQQCATAPASARPEQFNLPSALAKSFGIRGILFIQVAVSGSLLMVHVRNAALFLDHPPASCHVKVEIRRSPSNRKRTKYDHRFRCKQSSEVRDSGWPEFYDDFQFKVSTVHLKYGDKLGLAMYASQSPLSPAAELLGRMSFSLRKFFRMAKQQQQQQQWGIGGQQPVQVCEGGFFLLPDRLGQQSHLSQDNILHRKYYDEIGAGAAADGGGLGLGASGSSLSSASSFGSSPFKMMSEPEWPAHPTAIGRAAFMGGTSIANKLGQKVPAKGGAAGGQGGGRLLDSSQSSSSQSGVDCKRRAVPSGFPSVTTDTTTSDFTSSALTFSSAGPAPMAADSFSSGGAEVGGSGVKVELQVTRPKENRATSPPQPQHQQRAQSQPTEEVKTAAMAKTQSAAVQPCSSSSLASKPQQLIAEQANAVRRVASFTHSPTLLMNPQLYKKRNSVTTTGTALTDKMPRKNAFGALGKTLHFLKSKLDFSLSASVLCPSKEECRLWQDSFEALLNHKYGCMLFREFLQGEFSEENLEFWLECEHFKRMKEGKRQTLQRAQHIFNTYIKELASKEVNLDSETRLKTKAALEKSPLRPDVFNMAQTKIEQLMAKDSYPRFLKSEQYLELLNEREAAEKAGTANGLLRVASAKEGGAKVTKTGGRSPSLSPILTGRWGRRNTCSPTSPVTLQIPSIQE